MDLDFDLLILLYLTSLGFVIDLNWNNIIIQKHIFPKTTCGSVEPVWPNFDDSDLVHCSLPRQPNLSRNNFHSFPPCGLSSWPQKCHQWRRHLIQSLRHWTRCHTRQLRYHCHRPLKKKSYTMVLLLSFSCEPPIDAFSARSLLMVSPWLWITWGMVGQIQIWISISDPQLHWWTGGPPALPCDLSAILSIVIKISAAPYCQTWFLKVTDLAEFPWTCFVDWKTGRKKDPSLQHKLCCTIYIFGAKLAYFPTFGVNYSQKFWIHVKLSFGSKGLVQTCNFKTLALRFWSNLIKLSPSLSLW